MDFAIYAIGINLLQIIILVRKVKNLVIQASYKYSIKIAESENSKKMLTKCSKCKIEIQVGEEYNHHLKVLCEDCCVDIRIHRFRKTHWQYLKSIKTEYFIPSNKD